jgi:uncharacterized membrane protein
MIRPKPDYTFLIPGCDSISLARDSMKTVNHYLIPALAVLLTGCLLAGPAAAAPAPDYTTTYMITVREDGTALWQLEYRTLLASDDDVLLFENYTRDLPSLYLPAVKDLMQRSAFQASVATSRPMTISNVTGNALVQTTPAGRYGIVIYSFGWSEFAEPDGHLTIGDAFAGGLYLAKDNTLIIRYPDSWTATRVEPTPDLQRDGLIWYGLRSFSSGEPRVMLEKPPAVPLIPVIIATMALIVAFLGFTIYRQKKRRAEHVVPGEPVGPGEPIPVSLSATEEANLEERIIGLLKAGGGVCYQSEMVKALGIPKSTISSSLNSLHQQGVIQKVRKGRENLIRLVQDRM